MDNGFSFASDGASIKDNKLNALLNIVVTEVTAYAQGQIKNIKKLSEIGIALSVEKDMNRLFEMILTEARRFCRAEAGTLYILDKEDQSLRFEILQNDMIPTGSAFSQLPNVPLYIDNQPNHSNVSSHAVITGTMVNLPDIYHLTGTESNGELDFTGTKNYDQVTGYRTKSMLVIPMKNHEDVIIGVLQLINAKDEETDGIVPFSGESVDIVSSLASQAAIALTNAQLIRELKALFYAFIKSIARAIDEKSAYTGGHIRRVVELTMMMAEAINESDTGVFKDVHLDQAQLEELSMAAWMHDVGKITTAEYIVDKSSKLETIFDRLELVKTRFGLIQEIVKNNTAEAKLSLLASGQGGSAVFNELERERDKQILRLQEDFEFIESCNNTGDYMADEKVERIKEIGKRQYVLNNETFPVLSENEIHNLCIRKGTLAEDERKQVENHAKMTFDIISQLPFPKNLGHVPEYAASHHERPDGTGYPEGLSGKALALQSRIIAVADIFEALTAKDRPYKRPMNLSRAIEILESMKKNKQVDADILDLFLKNRSYLEYAKKEMSPSQIDMG